MSIRLSLVAFVEKLQVMRCANNILAFLCTTILCGCACYAQDTLQRRKLENVTVTAKAPQKETTTTAPVQILTKVKLERINALQLSDAVKQLSGVVLKDYGGVGGIKTVSARGLGSQFSTLTIDGMAVGDCQNGQPDLGKYIVSDVESLSFANGQTDDILQPARLLASGNVLDMQTAKPRFHGKSANLKLGFEAGSFGLMHPSLSYEQKFGRRLALSLQGTYVQSDGDYPFTIYYTQSKSDSSSRHRRTHSAVRMANIETNLFYDINNTQKLTAKVHYYNAFQQLPGPVIYYRETPGSESSADQSGFVQLHYTNRLSSRWNLRVDGKFYAVRNIYDDSAYQGSTGLLHNEYRQAEYYLTGAAQYRWTDFLRLSYSSDYFYNSLNSNVESCAEVGRHSWLNALSAKANFNKLSITASALYSLHSESLLGEFAKEYRHFTPYIGIVYKPLINKSLRFRYFFKQNYRLPNFNECYYAYMSRDLKPEKALQNNLGVTFDHRFNKNVFRNLTLILDGYYNRVSDKIVAFPRQSLYMWSMMNIGLVSIAGVDGKVAVELDFAEKCGLSLDATYTFQRALDITDPESKTYHQQIPYTPVHSLSASAYFTNPIVDFGYNLIIVGDRYRLAQNTAENLVEGYVDQSITLAKKIPLRYGVLKLQAQVLNIFDIQYEVVKSYPMMGRNYKIKAIYEF